MIRPAQGDKKKTRLSRTRAGLWKLGSDIPRNYTFFSVRCKEHFSILLLLVWLIAGCSQPQDTPIVGVWLGEDERGRRIMLEFRNNGTVQASTAQDVLDGEYSADFSKSPAHLDMTWESSEPIRTIVKVEGDSLTVEPAEAGADRPTAFSEEPVVYRREGSGQKEKPARGR